MISFLMQSGGMTGIHLLSVLHIVKKVLHTSRLLHMSSRGRNEKTFLTTSGGRSFIVAGLLFVGALKAVSSTFCFSDGLIYNAVKLPQTRNQVSASRCPTAAEAAMFVWKSKYYVHDLPIEGLKEPPILARLMQQNIFHFASEVTPTDAGPRRVERNGECSILSGCNTSGMLFVLKTIWCVL
jgi:hypothetical protein